MLIPIRDHNHARRFPYITLSLIVVNTGIFLMGLFNPAITSFYSMIPAEVTNSPVHPIFFARGITRPEPLIDPQWTLFTSMFLHGGWLHLIMNMWSLWIFGNNVEDALGHFRYLFLYIFWGYLAGWSHILFNWASPIPTVGASGAIAGVMGAYLILFPRARIECLLFYFIIAFVEVPAIFFLLFWFISQFMVYNPGVAYLAHVGGFVAGFLTIKALGGPYKILGVRSYEFDDD